MSGHSLGGYQIVSAVSPRTHERSHAGDTYLSRTRGWSNLEIVRDVLVDKITFTSDDPLRVSGDSFNHKKQVYSVQVNEEVVLCGGILGSPALLERSGFGWREVLESLGIPLLVENENVGEILQDHLMTGVSFELKDGIETGDRFRDPKNVQSALRQYQESRMGPLAAAFANFAYMSLFNADN